MKKKVDESWKNSILKEKNKNAPNEENNTDKKQVSSSQNQQPTPQTDSSFLELISFLAQNSVACMTGTPDGSIPQNIELANKMIAMMTALEKKSQLSLSDEEKNYLSKVLYELRVMSVEKSKKNANEDDNTTSTQNESQT